MRRSMSRIAVVCLCCVGSGYAAAPQPAAVQGPNRWTLRVTAEPLRQVVVPAGLQAEPMRFWYTVLSIENATGRDVDFYPQADLLTDTFQLVPAGKGVAADVLQGIKVRHAANYPLLEELPATGTAVLQGRDHARDFAVIWPDFDPKAKAVALFIAGLSNETAVIDHPTDRDQNGRPVEVFLKKTLELDFAVQGESYLRTDRTSGSSRATGSCDSRPDIHPVRQTGPEHPLPRGRPARASLHVDRSTTPTEASRGGDGAHHPSRSACTRASGC